MMIRKIFSFSLATFSPFVVAHEVESNSFLKLSTDGHQFSVNLESKEIDVSLLEELIEKVELIKDQAEMNEIAAVVFGPSNHSEVDEVNVRSNQDTIDLLNILDQVELDFKYPSFDAAVVFGPNH